MEGQHREDHRTLRQHPPEEEALRIQRWETWNLLPCPQPTLTLLKHSPDENAGSASVRAGKHLTWGQSVCLHVDGFPWKPTKPRVSTFASKRLLSRRKSCVASSSFMPWLIDPAVTKQPNWGQFGGPSQGWCCRGQDVELGPHSFLLRREQDHSSVGEPGQSQGKGPSKHRCNF